MCSRLLKCLMITSEKAANVARVCRSNEHLFSLLVEEKRGAAANRARFVKDFKTLADVLIQEMVRHDVAKLFPELSENIRGEEEATFTNTLGESVTVEVSKEGVKATADILEKVLASDKEAARLLAEEVHREDVLKDYDWSAIEAIEKTLNFAEFGIWIDPIDGTAEYISGRDKVTKNPNIKANGLECVTVLLGVYEIESGTPVMGVINQPFDDKSKIHWGVSIDGLNANNIEPPVEHANTKTVLLSLSEDRKYIYYLRDTLKYNLIFSSGAGHKLLKLIQGHAELFLVSKASTFLWDTCAPHAILRSLGGNLINLKETIDTKRAVELNYSKASGKCNIGGVMGFRTQAQLLEFSKML